MTNARALAIATLLASFVPPIALEVIAYLITDGNPDGVFPVAVIAWLVGLLHILLLGLPLFLYLQRRQRLTPLWLGCAGFLAGAIPGAVIGIPRHLDGYSSGMNWHGTYVELYVDGTPTIYAWLTHVESSASWGIYGVLTALTALVAWRFLSKPARRALDA